MTQQQQTAMPNCLLTLMLVIAACQQMLLL
jgi:hypothetical protein